MVASAAGTAGWARAGRGIGAARAGLSLAAVVATVAGLAIDWDGRGATFVATFLGIFLEAFPFLLLGVIVSALIEALVSPERLRRLLPSGRLGAPVAGGLLGLLFPVCECGVIPVGRRLILMGAPTPLAFAFVLAGPVLNPVAIASTWVAFDGDPLVVGGRVGLTLLVAVVVAAVVGLYPSWPLLDERVAPLKRTGPEAAVAGGRAGRAVDELFEMGRYLVLGAVVAAAIQAFVPRGALLALGQDPVSSVAVLMGLGALLSICSTVDAFVALPFAGLVGPGALLGFLVLGPMVDVKAALMLGGLFRAPIVLVGLGLATQLVFLAAVAVNLNVP